MEMECLLTAGLRLGIERIILMVLLPKPLVRDIIPQTKFCVDLIYASIR